MTTDTTSRRQQIGAVLASTMLLTATIGGAVLFDAPAAQAAPLTCTSDFFLPGAAGTIAERTPSGVVNTITTSPSIAVQSIAFNPVDDELYATAQPGTHLFRIDGDGATTDLGVIPGPGSSLGISPDGTVWTVNGSSLIRIDLTTMAVTTIPLSAGGVGGDIAFVGDQMYAWGGNPNALARIDVTTGTVQAVPLSGLGPVSALWSSNGHLYAGAGTTIREAVGLDTASPSLVNPGVTMPFSAGDGASCASAPSPFLAATDDDLTGRPIDAASGGTTGSVLVNDLHNGIAVSPSDVTTGLVNNGGLVGATIGTDGTITVSPGGNPGSYSLQYQICLVTIPQICDIATVSILVSTGSPAVAPGPGSDDPALPVTGTNAMPAGLAALVIVALGLTALVTERLRSRMRRRG
ncbi:MAG TPA: hypothetical protein VHZ98_02605 [Galbitalea sp.]|jgi:hypothetical protein|nr:hypothetical protein [Galbitalea sp.]